MRRQRRGAHESRRGTTDRVNEGEERGRNATSRMDGAECDEVVAAQGRHTPLPMTNQLSAKTSTATSLTSD